MSSKTILIVEDEYYLAENVKMRFEFLGYQVLIAENGQLALDMLKEQPVDVILMDAMMPVMDGWEATRLIKEDKRTHDIPIIFVSALARPEDQRRALGLDVVEYITKPFEADKLVQSVEAIIGKP